MDPERADAVNEKLAGVARKWFGVQNLPRDRELPDNARNAIRITAYMQADDGRWRRGELVVAQPMGAYVVWQPFPQGRPVVIDGPFTLTPSRTPPAMDDRRTAEEFELATRATARLVRLIPDDAARLQRALAEGDHNVME